MSEREVETMTDVWDAVGAAPDTNPKVELDVEGLSPRTFWTVETFVHAYEADPESEGARQVDYDEAFLIGSRTEAGTHRPVLDLDFPVQVVESSPGHHHLYLDVEVEHEAYMDLLDALARCGIIEEGYARASRTRGLTRVRKPEALDQPKPW